jgi:DNA-binding IclR family transcriptional regulator
VKSARRVFEILEHFAQAQRELSVADVARQLGYPQSSASALMRTMTELGYLHYETGARTYLPTARLPLLVGWIGHRLFREGRVVQAMNELSQATGETIILGAENGLQVRYIHVIEATGPLRLHSVAGSLRPYTRSAIGLALLGTHDDRRVGRIVRRLNSEEPDPARHVKLPELLKRLAEIRACGYALSVGEIVRGGGALAMVLPERVNGTPLAVAIAGAEASVLANCDEWISIMREAIARSFAEPATAEVRA